MGWYVGGFFLIFYACICFYLGLKKPKKILEMAKKKLGRGVTDKVTVILCYVIAVISLIVATVLLYFGYINQ